MPTTETPYVAVIFTSVRTATDDTGYDAMAVRMAELAREQPGFIDVESVRDTVTRQGITVSYWRTAADATAWKSVAEHAHAQALGRQRWYESYTVRIAQVERSYQFAGPAAQ